MITTRLPTTVLVHGAFAESASRDRVVDALLGAGHAVIAAANPLRRPSRRRSATSSGRWKDRWVPVGHSYGGAVISNVDADAGAITGVVHVNGFAPEPGETCFTLAGRFLGSTLGDALESGRQGAC